MIHFLLPVYNESINLSRVIGKIALIAGQNHAEYCIVAVDDGSTDNSYVTLTDLGKKHPIHIVRHERNRGPGAAFRSGFDEVLRRAQPTDVVITMDADNTHSAKTVALMLSALDEGYETVIASVFAPGGMMIGVPFLRYTLTILCNLLYRVLFPVSGIREYTGFYRGYRVETLLTARERFGGILFIAPGFGSMAELLIRLRQIPVFMKEVPMIVRYDQKGGKSKMRILATIFEHIGIIARNVFARRII